MRALKGLSLLADFENGGFWKRNSNRQSFSRNPSRTRNLALINVHFESSIKTTNLHLKHCLLEVAAIAYISKICRNNLCKLPIIKTLGFGLDSLSFRGSFLWNTLDDSIKQVPTLSRFKKRMKDWTADRCTCKICR